MLQGVAVPQVALVTTPVLSARPQFSFGQSNLVFTPTKAYEPSKLQDSGADDLAKSLKEISRQREEERKQEMHRKQLELAEKRQEEAERHNRMTERIRAASEGIDGMGESGGGGYAGDFHDAAAVGVIRSDEPIRFKADAFELSPAPVEALKSSPEKQKRNTEKEIPKPNSKLDPLDFFKTPTTQVSVDGNALANIVLPEEFASEDTVTCSSKEECEAKGMPTKASLLSTSTPPEPQADKTSSTSEQTKQFLAGVKLPPFANYLTAIGSGIKGFSEKTQAEEPKPAPEKEQLPDAASDEGRIGKALPTIALKNGEAPYNRFKSYEAAKTYLEAVKRGTPELTAITPEAIYNSKRQIVGYEINWKDNSENLRKQEQKLADALAKKEKLTADQAAARSKLLLSEGRAVNAQDSIRNYTKPNGFREAVQRFIPAYNNATEADKKKLANVGLSDIDLIDNYARAMGGGKITEGQAHLISQAKTLKEKMQVLYGQNFGKGEQLSQAQRDTMLENMLEAHNSQARNANNILKRVRERLIVNGVKDELFLPETYADNLITKTKARSELTRLKDAVKSLRMDAEKVAGNKLLSQEERNKKIVKIGKMFEKYKSEIDHLSERLDDEEYSGTEILGLEDFEKAKGGFIAGDRMVAEAEKE